MTVPDFPDEKAPDAHATAISLTGAPLLNLHTQEYFNAGQNLGPGAGLNPAAIVTNQPGYIWRITATLVSGTPVGPVSLQLTWQDSGSGLLSGQRGYAMWPGTAGNGHTVTGYGRARGNRLLVNVTNQSAGATVNVVVLVASTSVPFTVDRAQSAVISGLASGNSLGLYDLNAGVIGSDDIVSMAAAATRTDDLALYQGKVWLLAQTSSGLADLNVIVFTTTDQGITGQNNRIFAANSDSSGNIKAEFALAGTQHALFFQNNNASARHVNYQLVAEDL